MRLAALLLTLSAAVGLAAPVAASQSGSLRSQIEVFVDERGLPDNVDRVCVIDRAVREHPNVPLTLVGPPLSGRAKEQHDENVRRLRIGLAVNAAIAACTPAPTEGN